MTSIKASDPSTAAKGEGVREIEHARQQLGFQANQPGPNNQETAPAGIGNSKRIAEHRSGGHVVINAISIGDRHRRDLGDIAGLAQNISARGLLHPIVINHDGRLIAGARRLAAAKVLGWTTVPVTVIDLEQIVLGEYAENAFRKDFSPSEMVAIAAALEPMEREKAKARQGERTDKHPILWLWVTNLFMREAFPLLEAWGFERRTILTWAKDRMGTGDWLRGQTEHAIMAVRGKPVVTLTNQTTLLNAPVRGHSQKPVEFYNLVESSLPGAALCRPLLALSAQ